MYVFNFDNLAEKKLNKVKNNSKEPTELKNDDLPICSLTVLGFSLNSKFWYKFPLSYLHYNIFKWFVYLSITAEETGIPSIV